MPWRSLLTVNCSPPGNSATSNLALLTSIPTTTCSAICLPPPVSSPPGFSLPCGAIRAWLSLATVRALTWRLGAWRPRSATVSTDSGEHGLPRLSFSLVWDSSDKIQGDSNRRSSFVVPGAYERLDVSAGCTVVKPIRELFSARFAGKLWPKTETSVAFPSGKKTKEDRRFEYPLLQQRGTANRRSDSRFLLIWQSATIGR